MLLLPDEITSLSRFLSNLGKYDDELISYCQDSLNDGRYDDAVMKSFLVLEKRLRLVTGIERETGPNLANQAFGNNSDLPRKMGMDSDPGMIAPHRQLYAGAFGVFRNPTAHQLDVGYTPNECRAILTLVNMLLHKLDMSQSPEVALKAIFKRSRASKAVQDTCMKIVDHFEDIDPEFHLRVGVAKIGLHSVGSRFAQITAQPQRLDFYVFTRGIAIKGVKPRTKNPRYGSFSHKRADKLATTMDVLDRCRKCLHDALDAGESLGSSLDIDESEQDSIEGGAN